MFSRIKELLILGSSIMLLGMVSCNKATDGPVQEADSGVVPTKVTLLAQLDNDTKASYAAGKVSWELGDKIVLFDDTDGVLAELVCISTLDGGKGFFSGPTPAGWTADSLGVKKVFFLGNRSIADPASFEVDFSAQDGTASGVSRFIFLYGVKYEGGEPKDVVTFLKSGDAYLASAPVTFNGSFNAIISMTFSGVDCPEGTPGENGYKAKKVTIEGLKNHVIIDLTHSLDTEDVVGAYTTKDVANEKTTITPGSSAEYASTYYLSVVPSPGNAVTITADYQDGGTGTTTVKWNSMDWSSVAAGNWYYINWSGKTLVQLSSKPGYSGQAVTGGENANGNSGKAGYGGANADGENENPTGNKNGYGGTEVL